MFKRINCSLITALAIATSAVLHIRNPLFTCSLIVLVGLRYLDLVSG